MVKEKHNKLGWRRARNACTLDGQRILYFCCVPKSSRVHLVSQPSSQPTSIWYGGIHTHTNKQHSFNRPLSYERPTHRLSVRPTVCLTVRSFDDRPTICTIKKKKKNNTNKTCIKILFINVETKIGNSASVVSRMLLRLIEEKCVCVMWETHTERESVCVMFVIVGYICVEMKCGNVAWFCCVFIIIVGFFSHTQARLWVEKRTS